MTEAVLEHGLPDVAVALGDAGESGDARLQVGGESRVERRHDVDRLQAVRAGDANELPLAAHLDPHLHQLGLEDVEVMPDDPAQGCVAPGYRGGHHQHAGVEAVVHDRVLGAVELVDAGDVHGARADALDLGPHLRQQFGEVGDVGIGSGVDDDRVPLGQTGGHDQVLDPGVARQVEVHLRAAKVVRPDVVAVRAGARNSCPHAGEPAVVVVGRPGPDRTASDIFDRHFPEAAEKGPDEQQRCAQPVRQLTGKLGGRKRGRVDHGDPLVGVVVDPRAQAAQDLHCQKHVLHRRDPVQDRSVRFRRESTRRSSAERRSWNPEPRPPRPGGFHLRCTGIR